MQMTGPTPKRRPLDFQTLAEVQADVSWLVEAGYDRLGDWSLAQVCDHLTLFMRQSLEGFEFRLPLPLQWIGRRVALPLTLRRRRMPAGMRSPSSLLPPTTQTGDREAVDRLSLMLDRVSQHGGELEPSPLFGRMSREQWRQIHLIHASHHLSFLIPRAALSEPTAG